MNKFTASDFHSGWIDFDSQEFVFYDKTRIDELGLPPEEVVFLVDAGLPKWPAPNLHFKDYIETISPQLCCIGTDRSQNRICLDKSQNGRLVWIDKTDARSTGYMNTSISKLCMVLSEYRNFVDKAYAMNEESILENLIPDKLIVALSLAIESIDPEAIGSKNAFWELEINRLLSHAKD